MPSCALLAPRRLCTGGCLCLSVDGHLSTRPTLAQRWGAGGVGGVGCHVQGDICGFTGETSEEKFAVTSHEWP